MFVKRFGVLYGGHTEHVRSSKPTARKRTEAIFLRRRPWKARPSAPGRWLDVTLLGASNHLCRSIYAVTWLAWAGLHSAAATGKIWAFWATRRF